MHTNRIVVTCPKCRIRVPMGEHEWPLHCRCGSKWLSADNMIRGKSEPKPIKPTGGPGTELTALFASLDVHERPDCNCKATAAEMDREGSVACRVKREQFVGKLRQNADKYSWWDKLKAGTAAVLSGKPLSLEGLYDEAIRRAEVKEDQLLAKVDALPHDADWRFKPEVASAQQIILDRAAAAEYTPPEWFSGRGIVTLGGGAKYFTAAYVMVSMLRRHGCQLPVEWWYLGAGEMDERTIELAESLGNIKCVDLYERLGAHGRKPRRIGGWEAKVWSVMFSGFQEVLFLDADNVPVKDPTFLFDEPQYREKGAIFWPDFPPMGWSVTETAFQIARLPVPGKTKQPDWKNPTDYKPFESGQFLVDKPRQWKALEVCATICNHSDFWFPSEHRGKPWNLYGDKDAFYLAWEKTQTPYAMPRKKDVGFAGGKHGGAFFQHDFGGQLLFQHRVQPVSKWTGETVEYPGEVHFAACVEILESLRAQWKGLYNPEDENESERQIAGTVPGHKLWFHPKGSVSLTFIPGGKTDREWTWTVRGNHLVLVGASRFGRDDRGNWVNHRTDNYLIDAPPDWLDCPPTRQEIAIWHDINRDNEYDLPERFDRDDVVLDIGGHCGFFAYACLSRGALVTSIEPHPENFRRLEANTKFFTHRRQLINAAVWRSDVPTDTLHLERKDGAQHTGGWCALGTVNGVKARALPGAQLFDRAIRLVKLDCEGSEWPILFTLPDSCFELVREWCGEYHLAPILATPKEAAVPGVTYGLPALGALFERHGYSVRILPHPKSELLGHFWARRP